MQTIRLKFITKKCQYPASIKMRKYLDQKASVRFLMRILVHRVRSKYKANENNAVEEVAENV